MNNLCVISAGSQGTYLKVVISDLLRLATYVAKMNIRRIGAQTNRNLAKMSMLKKNCTNSPSLASVPGMPKTPTYVRKHQGITTVKIVVIIDLLYNTLL